MHRFRLLDTLEASLAVVVLFVQTATVLAAFVGTAIA